MSSRNDGSSAGRDAAAPGSAAVTDRSLIRGVIAGEPGSRDAFVERYRPWIAGLAASRFRLSVADAEDLFQDVMVRLWQDDLRALRAWRGEGRFSTYLTVITCRLGLARVDDARANDRELAAELAPDGDHLDPAIGPSTTCTSTEAQPDADEQLLAAERARAVRDAMAALSGRDQLVLGLHYRDGRSFDDVGALLGLSAGTARKAAFDARRRLRDRLLDRHAELFAAETEP